MNSSEPVLLAGPSAPDVEEDPLTVDLGDPHVHRVRAVRSGEGAPKSDADLGRNVRGTADIRRPKAGVLVYEPGDRLLCAARNDRAAAAPGDEKSDARDRDDWPAPDQGDPLHADECPAGAGRTEPLRSPVRRGHDRRVDGRPGPPEETTAPRWPAPSNSRGSEIASWRSGSCKHPRGATVGPS
jgi:hypothetical protein